jgi:hypothetical protein
MGSHGHAEIIGLFLDSDAPYHSLPCYGRLVKNF